MKELESEFSPLYGEDGVVGELESELGINSYVDAVELSHLHMQAYCNHG